jgi:ABC-type nitrate/sulfonate/bicarbonate transport system permease component
MPTKRSLKDLPFIGLLAPIVLLVVLFIILEVFARLNLISDYILPAPSAILMNTIQSFSSTIQKDFFFTLKIVFLGFTTASVFGLLLAAIFSQFEIVTKAVSPVIIWLVITPMITLIPLIMLWLGNSPNIRALIVILQATPIITLNTLNGFTTVEKAKLELAKSVGATRMQRFVKITFMNAMPQVFTGIKLGCIFSVIGSVSADFVAKGIGMGNRIIQFTKYVKTDLTYGSIIIVALIGIVLYSLMSYIEKKIVIWKN